MNTATARIRPILLSAPMVIAILTGRKTQTRQIIAPQPDIVSPGDEENLSWMFSEQGHSGEGWYFYDGEYPDEGSEFARCRQGKPGDILYVRETFQISGGELDTGDSNCVDKIHIIYSANTSFRIIEVGRSKSWGLIVKKEGIQKKKFASMHMPQWASRIYLEITDVRVQRLQDITEEDAIAEGAVWIDQGRGHNNWKNTNCWFMDTEQATKPSIGGNGLGSARFAFANFWNCLYAGPNWNLKSGPEPWERNPWVWAISFKRIKVPKP